MARRKPKTKAQLLKQYERIQASMNEKDSQYPNLPRSRYNLQQQTAYVKSKKRFSFSPYSIGKMIDFADNRENDRREQAKQVFERMYANAKNGG